MSSKKTVQRRLGLLAGSSLLAAVAFTGLALTPGAALAANECGNPSTNGSAADIVTCATPPTYTTGVDYSTTTNGSLTVILQSRFDTGTAGTGGIRMFGKTGESMSLLRDDTPAGAGDPRVVNTAGRAIDVTTLGAGNVVINLTDGDPTSETSTNVTTGTTPIRITGSTDAIRAEALGTGAVSVTFADTGVASGVNNPRAVITAGTAVGSNGSGILARSTTGAINIDARGATFTINGTNGGSAIDAVSTSGNVTVNAGAATGRLRGILAQTGGAGTVTVNATANVGANGVTGLAGVETAADTGATIINITGGTVSGGAGAAIRSTSASISGVSVQNTGGTVNGRVDFSLVTAGPVTFNNTGATTSAGRWTASGASTFTGFNDTLTMGGVGQNTAASGTSLSFGAGADTWTLGGQFVATGTTVDFGTGNDSFSVSGLLAATTTSMDFGAGTDTFAMSGALAASGLTLANLEAFNLSGVVYLGGTSGTATNLAVGDVLKMTSGTFTGSGSARVVMDVTPGLGTQEGCATVTLADCLDLRGASTAGVTLLTLNDVNTTAAAPGGFNPTGLTLVDVGGAGTSAAGHFVIDPSTPGYVADPVLGGAIERPGLFRYALQYDAANQRHVLVGLPRGETMEYAMATGAAQSIWHMTADTVTNRQTDLRDGAEGGSVWMRATGQYSERTLETTVDNLGQTFAFDNSYKLYAGSIMGGMDFVTGSSGGYDYVFGGQIGYVGSSFELKASPSTGQFAGATGGVYASLWSPRFFLDGTLNANVLTLDYASPGLGSKTNTYLNALGGKAEGGARVQLGERAFLEPLASVAYVRTSFEEISLAGGEIQPADAASLRGALGLRLGANMVGQAINASYYLTGRAWNEFEGDNTGVVHNPGADLAFGDDFSGGFGEAEFGVSLFNAANTVSGFLTSGVKFKDGYNTIDLAGGVRLAW